MFKKLALQMLYEGRNACNIFVRPQIYKMRITQAVNISLFTRKLHGALLNQKWLDLSFHPETIYAGLLGRPLTCETS